MQNYFSIQQKSLEHGFCILESPIYPVQFSWNLPYCCFKHLYSAVFVKGDCIDHKSNSSLKFCTISHYLKEKQQDGDRLYKDESFVMYSSRKYLYHPPPFTVWSKHWDHSFELASSKLQIVSLKERIGCSKLQFALVQVVILTFKDVHNIGPVCAHVNIGNVKNAVMHLQQEFLKTQ